MTPQPPVVPVGPDACANDALRREVVDVSRRLVALGLNRGTSGNVGVRTQEGLLITPSGVPAELLAPQALVTMDRAGAVTSAGRPSSEWRFHLDILNARAEAGAVIHVHSPFATTLACLGIEVPPFHYMIAVAGGSTIRCAPYALFGSQQLSDHALAALEGRKACLLGNHGMIALGDDLGDALAVAVEVEALCEQYWRALQIGTPRCLSDDEMREVVEKFRHYGRRAARD
ncbi:class II aldolase/adducin family protein [Trinickia caryophylli]|nr:class II aldolase/adducin family protein [Trinickia caryophylli]PMS11328.1 class II aldolase [Trinickia caryophylli]TRX20435.1 class II aldolase [Trinickia caryophylli]WQE13840.1 class II aldolase/adducin family protein [Trinickia caryophylli]